MSTIGKVTIDLAAQYAQFTQGMQTAGKSVDALRGQMDHLKKSAAGSDVFDKLRESLGSRSALGETTELLNGGGARLVGGLTGAAEAIQHVAEEAGKLKEAFDGGTMSAGEIGEQLLKQIPIVGQFWTAGKAIRELFTGEQADINAANETAKVLDETIKAQHAEMEILADSARSYAEYWERAAHAIAQARLPEGQKSEEASRYDEKSEHDRLEKERQEELDKARNAAQPAIDHARKAALGASDAASHSHDQVKIAEASARAQQLASIASMAVRTQREAEAKINADYDAQQVLNAAVHANQRIADHDKQADEHTKAVQEAGERDAKQVADAQTAAEEDALRAKGKNYEADVVELKHALAEKLEAIHKEAQEESKLFNPDDQSNQARVAAEEQVKIAAAQQAAQAELDAAGVEHKKKQEEEAAAALEHAMADQKQMQEDAQKLTEESVSPLQKYAEEVERINLLRQEGLISEQTQAAAIDKQNRELGQQLHGGPAEKPEAEIRRFDFNLGKQAQLADPLKVVSEHAKTQTQIMQQSQKYMDYWYSNGIKTDTVTADIN